MRWFKRSALLLLILFLGGTTFSFARVLRNPELLYRLLGNEIEASLGARLSAENVSLVFTPFPRLELERPRLEPGTSDLGTFSAETAQFAFHWLPLLWGKAQPSGFRVIEGKGTLERISLEEVSFKIKGLKPNGSAPFEFKGRVAGGKETVRSKGKLTFKSPSEDLWRDLGIQGELSFQLPSLTAGLGEALLKRFPQADISGELAGNLRLQKKTGTKLIGGVAEFEVKDFRSRASESFSLKGTSNLAWDFEKGAVTFESLTFQSPFGSVEGKGSFLVETGEVKEVRFLGREVVLDELLRRFPDLQTFLPVDIGFSGPSDFDLSLRGSWDYLSLYGNWNLSPTVLSYGKLFLKPKDLPMAATLDLLLKGGSQLSGDFSVRIQETVAKGAIAGVDLNTGEGEVTILTNKFDLGSWVGLLPSFTNYQFSGSAKVLVSTKGNLGRAHSAQKMWNVTLENASLLTPRGKGIRKAKMLLDVSPLSIRVKNTSFEIDGSPVELDGEIYNYQETPQGNFRASSPRLNPFELITTLKQFNALFRAQGGRIPWRRWERTLPQFFPRTVALEQFVCSVKANQGKLTLETAAFRTLDGSAELRGEVEWPAEKPRFWITLQVDRASLAKYFEALAPGKEILEGNLFYQGRFEGEGGGREAIMKSLTGQGFVSVTNGEWHSFNLSSSVRSFEPFEALIPQGASDGTPFYDLKVAWSYKEGKFETGHLVLHSDDFWVEGEGNLSLDGILNTRLGVYLSKELTRKILESWGEADEAKEKQLGPIPFLLVGNLMEPRLSSDERQLEGFMEEVRSRKLRKILHEPFKE